MKMWLILLINLAYSVCGIFAVKKSPAIYRAEENDSITIMWDIQAKHNLSAPFVECVFQSEPLKIVYYMVKGDEVPEYQHQQFSGRVQFDRDALTDGQMKLHLSKVTTGDSGLYQCDMAVDYDKVKRQWVFKSTEHFVLNVTRASNVFLTTPKLPEGRVPDMKEDRVWNHIKYYVNTVVGIVTVIIILLSFVVICIV